MSLTEQEMRKIIGTHTLLAVLRGDMSSKQAFARRKALEVPFDGKRRR